MWISTSRRGPSRNCRWRPGDTSRRRRPESCGGQRPQSARRHPPADLPTMWTITFSRPRWLMASTICSAPKVRGAIQHFIHHRDQGDDAFQGEALGADVARLQHLLEKCRRESGARARGRNPPAAGRLPCARPPTGGARASGMCMNSTPIDAAIAPARPCCGLAFERKLGRRQRLQVTQGVKVRSEVTPTAKCVEHCFICERDHNLPV